MFCMLRLALLQQLGERDLHVYSMYNRRER
jgi:hypothetical protein